MKAKKSTKATAKDKKWQERIEKQVEVAKQTDTPRSVCL